MGQTTKTAIAIVAIVVLAGAFWLLLLAPERERASELSAQVTAVRGKVAAAGARAAAGAAAKREFPRRYRQLVLLGKAVPSEPATPSLLVQLNGLGRRARTSFVGIQLNGGQGGPPAPGSEAEPTAATATARPPLGATAGPAGFAAMPYTLDFRGGFFDVARFLHGLDALVETRHGEVDATGRLVTIDGFQLVPEAESARGGGALAATFNVTTYVTPPGQGLTAGATAAGPTATGRGGQR